MEHKHSPNEAPQVGAEGRVVMQDTRKLLLADARERLDQERDRLADADYAARVALLAEALAEPAAPYDLLVAEALEGLS